VPDLRHKTVGQAEFELSILGLRIGMISHTHSERHATALSIIATTPGVGTELARGERVHLLVSLGPRPVEMTMPTLTGMTLAQARKLAKEQLLYVDKVERRRAPREKADLVLAQIPPAGSRVLSGSGVTLTVNEPSARAGGASRLVIIQHTVSGGVPEDVGPAADGGSADNGEPVVDGGGAENGDPTVDGDATADGEPVQHGGDGPPLANAPRLIRVRIMLRDDTGYRELYDEMALPGETISFPRNVVGEVTLTVYEDDMNEPIRRETL
jgi:serine/threonine-protein kinase